MGRNGDDVTPHGEDAPALAQHVEARARTTTVMATMPTVSPTVKSASRQSTPMPSDLAEAKRAAAAAQAEAAALRRECDAIAARAALAEKASDEAIDELAHEVALAKMAAEDAAAARDAAVTLAEAARGEATAAVERADRIERKGAAEASRADQLSAEAAKLRARLKSAKREVGELRTQLDEARRRSANDQIELLRWAQRSREETGGDPPGTPRGEVGARHVAPGGADEGDGDGGEAAGPVASPAVAEGIETDGFETEAAMAPPDPSANVALRVRRVEEAASRDAERSSRSSAAAVEAETQTEPFAAMDSSEAEAMRRRVVDELEPELSRTRAELASAESKLSRAEAAEADMRERTRSLRASNEAIIRHTEKMALEVESLRYEAQRARENERAAASSVARAKAGRVAAEAELHGLKTALAALEGGEEGPSAEEEPKPSGGEAVVDDAVRDERLSTPEASGAAGHAEEEGREGLTGDQLNVIELTARTRHLEKKLEGAIERNERHRRAADEHERATVAAEERCRRLRDQVRSLRADRARLAEVAKAHCAAAEQREMKLSRRAFDLEEEVRELGAKCARAKKKAARVAASCEEKARRLLAERADTPSARGNGEETPSSPSLGSQSQPPPSAEEDDAEALRTARRAPSYEVLLSRADETSSKADEAACALARAGEVIRRLTISLRDRGRETLEHIGEMERQRDVATEAFEAHRVHQRMQSAATREAVRAAVDGAADQARRVAEEVLTWQCEGRRARAGALQLQGGVVPDPASVLAACEVIQHHCRDAWEAVEEKLSAPQTPVKPKRGS